MDDNCEYDCDFDCYQITCDLGVGSEDWNDGGQQKVVPLHKSALSNYDAETWIICRTVQGTKVQNPDEDRIPHCA